MLLIALWGCTPEPSPEPPPGCNGHEHLCDRRLDEVAFAGTHNAMSSEDQGWIAPNQHFAPAQQLGDGVRTIVYDTHYADDGLPALCHGYCSLGQTPLVDGLRVLTDFLDAHPDEIVVLILESYVTEADTVAVFEAADLTRYAYAGSSAPWPTLGTLVADDTRLIVFTDDSAVTTPWLRYSYTSMWENPYHAESKDELLAQCHVDRGDASLPLWTLNHFLTDPLASADLAADVNVDPFFTERVAACREETGDFPNFVLVDFYDVGVVLDVVAALNAP